MFAPRLSILETGRAPDQIFAEIPEQVSMIRFASIAALLFSMQFFALATALSAQDNAAQANVDVQQEQDEAQPMTIDRFRPESMLKVKATELTRAKRQYALKQPFRLKSHESEESAK